MVDATLPKTLPLQPFDLWKVVAISSLAVALINLGLLYFLTMQIRTLILADDVVFNSHPTYVLTQPVASPSATPKKSLTR
mgnify:CR=1 FL=1